MHDVASEVGANYRAQLSEARSNLVGWKLTAVFAAITGVLTGFAGGFLFGYSNGRTSGIIDTQVEQAFWREYGPGEEIVSGSAADMLNEKRNAYVLGNVPSEPYYNSPETLEDIAEEGRKLRKSLR